MSSLGERLRRMRMRQGYSQIELAELLNTSNANISNWERGSRKPSPETISELAKLFNVSSDYLLNGVDTSYLVQTLLSYEGLPEEVVQQYGKSDQIVATSTVYYVPVVSVVATGDKLLDYNTVIDEYRPRSNSSESCIYFKQTSLKWEFNQPGDAYILVKRTDSCANGGLGVFLVMNKVNSTKKRVFGRVYYGDDIVVISPSDQPDAPILVREDEFLCLGQVIGIEVDFVE